VAGIASQLGGRPPGHNWCSRFVERHRSELDSRYLDSLDLDRHQASSVASFEQYFKIAGAKIEEYGMRRDFCLGGLPRLRGSFQKISKPQRSF
jgi:hypothetical protein